MGYYKEIIKDSTISHRIHIRCLIPVPDVYRDESAACAMGDSISEKAENLERVAEELLAPQYFSTIRRFVSMYERSRLPIGLIYEQEVQLESLDISRGYKAFYDTRADIIIEDADTCVMQDGAHIFGHMIGYKLIKFKGPELVSKALWELEGIMGCADTHLLKTIHCDGIANLLTSEHRSPHELLYGLSDLKIEGIEKTALAFAWRI